MFRRELLEGGENRNEVDDPFRVLFWKTLPRQLMHWKIGFDGDRQFEILYNDTGNTLDYFFLYKMDV